LAGLALLALSFTVRADVVAPVAAPLPVSVVARAEVSATDTDQAEEPDTVQLDEPGAAPAAQLFPATAQVVAVEPAKMLDSECQHDAAPRAPPLA
jgi:hypothetical protein